MPISYCLTMNLLHLTPAQLRQAANIKEQMLELESELIKLSGSVVSQALTVVKAAGKKMSIAAKAKLSAAAKARWAKIKGASVAPVKKTKKTMSPAAKAKISAAAKARWAKIKAAKK